MRLLLRAVLLTAATAALATSCSSDSVGRSIAATTIGEQSAYIPAVIHVAKGEKVRLRVTNNTDKDHGFSIDEYSIRRVVKAHETINESRTANKSGTFKVYCQLHPAHVPADLVVG